MEPGRQSSPRLGWIRYGEKYSIARIWRGSENQGGASASIPDEPEEAGESPHRLLGKSRGTATNAPTAG